MRQRFISELSNLNQIMKNRPREPKPVPRLRDYGYGRIDFYKKSIETAVEKVRMAGFELGCLYKYDKGNKDIIISILEIIKDDFSQKLDELIRLGSLLKEKQKQGKVRINIPKNLPPSIKSNVVADLRELESSFNSGCFRAATILCGRILETCLHRKYYESTGRDILEKNPGIGLGKLIAKLAEKDVKFDPGLTQQIHLINQVRIHSVHVKKQSFYPSRQQTYAMILYTIDVMDKMF